MTIAGDDLVITQLSGTTPRPVRLADRPRLAATMIGLDRYRTVQERTLARLRAQAVIVYAEKPRP